MTRSDGNMQPMHISAGHSSPSNQTSSPWVDFIKKHLKMLLIFGVLITGGGVYLNTSIDDGWDPETRGVLLEVAEATEDTHLIHYKCLAEKLQVSPNDITVQPPSLLMPFPKILSFDEVNGRKTSVSISSSLQFFVSKLIVENSADNASIGQERLRQSVEVFCAHAKGVDSQDTSVTTINVNVLNTSLIEKESLDSLCQSDNTEEYRVTIASPSKVTVDACSVSAAQHACASTLLQLFSSHHINLEVPSLPYVIQDFPQYTWRGLMVDVTRHFVPLTLLKRCVDAMQLSKLNVLHLHLSDAQSFPMLLDDTPELKLSQLAAMGAYDIIQKVYTKDSLIDLVGYARVRGVDIVPEIDVPAHTHVWGKAFPGIIVNCPEVAALSHTPLDVYALDPSNPLTYKVIEGVLSQVVEIFPSSHIHVGADEVDFRCWDANPTLRQWISKQNSTNVEVFRAFEQRIFEIVRKLKRTPIAWQGIIDSGALPLEDNDGVNEPSVIQSWKCWSGLSIRASKNALKTGHATLMSSCWYLDYDVDWLAMMSVDQLETTLSKSQDDEDIMKHSSMALGGEAAMWTENVDHTNLECRMWPRAGAVAARLWGLSSDLAKKEELWNGKALTVSTERSISIMSSMVHFRHLLLQAGVHAAPVTFHRKTGSYDGDDIVQYEIEPFGKSWSEDRALKYIMTEQKAGMIMSSNNKLVPRLVDGSLRLTCRCEGFKTNEAIQRPIYMNEVKLLQLNVADGTVGTKESSILEWFEQKANIGVLLIGLCELNGWQKLQSTTDISKNTPLSEYYASKGGFVHSFVMVNSQPYNLGVLSALQFEVYGQYGPPQFQRGLLHVFVSKLALHVFVVHLHAHESSKRIEESVRITSILKPLLANNSRVVLMGDMNTLSPLDKKQHDEMGLLVSLQRTRPEVWPRLGKKFLTTEQDSIDYEPMNNLLKCGMHDACVYSCKTRAGATKEQLWSMTGTHAYDRCIQKNCPASEPTKYSTEWPDLPNGEKHPFVRLDYILVSDALIEPHDVHESPINAYIDHDNRTELMSDHFPMAMDWVLDRGYQLFN